MTTWISINIGSGNGLSPDGTKAITWTNVDLTSMVSSGIHKKAISQEVFNNNFNPKHGFGD